jgi:phospholipase C
MLVISPFSRGGFVCPDTFDHTSMLRFLETRFGTEVPNLSAWRRNITGDLTTAFNFVAPNASKPTLPKPSLLSLKVLGSNCAAEGAAGILDEVGFDQLDPEIAAVEANYPVPAAPQSMPVQSPGTAPTPSGPVTCTT